MQQHLPFFMSIPRVLFPAWSTLSHWVDVITPLILPDDSAMLCRKAPQESPHSLDVCSMAPGTPSFTTLHQLRLFARCISPTLDYIQLDGKTVFVYGSIYLSLALGTWQAGSDHPGELNMTPQCNWGSSKPFLQPCRRRLSLGLYSSGARENRLQLISIKNHVCGKAQGPKGKVPGRRGREGSTLKPRGIVFGVEMSLVLGLHYAEGKVIARTSYLDKKRLSLTGAGHLYQHWNINFVLESQ